MVSMLDMTSFTLSMSLTGCGCGGALNTSYIDLTNFALQGGFNVRGARRGCREGCREGCRGESVYSDRYRFNINISSV